MKLAVSLTLAGLVALAAGATLWRASAREAAIEAAHPPSGQVLDVDGTPVHVHVSGDGPDLILLHGAGGSLRDFTFSLAPRLADRYRVIAMDRPGHGYTGTISAQTRRDGASPRQQAILLQGAARQLGVERAIVLGQSFGGSIAMAWALEDPAMTAAIVTVAGATMPWPGGLGAAYHLNAGRVTGAVTVPLATAWTNEAYITGVFERIFAPAPVPDGYVDHFAPMLSVRRGVLRHNARQVTGLFPHVTAMSGQYATITAPVELIHGTADTIVPAHIHSRPLSHLLPDVRLTLLEGAGHMPHHEAEDAVVAAIDRAAARSGLR